MSNETATSNGTCGALDFLFPDDSALDSPLTVFVHALPIVLAALTWLIWEVAHRHGRNALPPSTATVARRRWAWRRGASWTSSSAGAAPGVAARVCHRRSSLVTLAMLALLPAGRSPSPA